MDDEMSTPAPTPLRAGFTEMMSSSVYTPVRTGFREKRRMSIALPTLSSPEQDRIHRHSNSRRSPWTVPLPLSIPIPGMQTRRLRLPMPNPSRFRQAYATFSNPRRGSSCLFIGLFAIAFTLFVFVKRWPWVMPGKKSTLVFQREDLQRIWKWEIESGHYPSSRQIPRHIGLTAPPRNPALSPSPYGLPEGPIFTDSIGMGPRRLYIDIRSQPPDVAYPPRPAPGSVADLDVVMDHCDFSQQKYVRDCLEVLRLGAGLDTNARLRRGSMDQWKYIYLEQAEMSMFSVDPPVVKGKQAVLRQLSWFDHDLNRGLRKMPGAEWEPPLRLPEPKPHHPYVTLPSPCDDENPRLFHMFWTGPFTDKPYTALLSFLYTQNTGIHLHESRQADSVCRPQFWLWIYPGDTTSITDLTTMYDQLKANPWAAPLLHPRFQDVITFKIWNTTEQLDGVPEMKDEWRTYKDRLLNSGGDIIKVGPKNETGTWINRRWDGDDRAHAVSKSSTVLSDMARFVLCHRFGGIYLDADTIFLRDWEELWGWKGAFAYRWSRLPDYNTAVLRMNKGSALGSFLLRTALRNGLDFHPMTITRYTRDAHLQGLLLRLPDALFDSAWLNTEYFQRDRPPQPHLTSFEHFFDTPVQEGAAPHALGFDGFFKGAYSYHFHNFWRKPFDPARNWPDLGPRFLAGERMARTAAGVKHLEEGDKVASDKRDLDWATVLKRTFEAYIRGERPNMYGEWIDW